MVAQPAGHRVGAVFSCGTEVHRKYRRGISDCKRPMCLRLSWPSVPPSLRNVTKSPAHVYEPAAAAVVKALQHATPQAAHACGAIAPQNHTKVRTMLQILSLADLQPFESAFWRALPERLKNGGPVLGNHSSSVLDTWWVQHTALELVRHPWCYAPPRRLSFVASNVRGRMIERLWCGAVGPLA